MKNCYVKAYYDWIEQTAALSDAERGRLFIAVLEYARSGFEPKLDGRESILFPVFRATIDRDTEKSKRMSQNGALGGRGNKATESKEKQMKANESEQKPTNNIRHKTEEIRHNTQDYISPPTPSLQKIPTLAEVEEYAKMRGGLIDPKPFYEFYSVSGWRDTEGKPVYNWQQKFQLWEKRELEKPKKPGRGEKTKDNSWMKAYLGGNKA